MCRAHIGTLKLFTVNLEKNRSPRRLDTSGDEAANMGLNKAAVLSELLAQFLFVFICQRQCGSCPITLPLPRYPNARGGKTGEREDAFVASIDATAPGNGFPLPGDRRKKTG